MGQRISAKTGQFVLVLCTVLAAATFNDPACGDDVSLLVGSGAQAVRQSNGTAGSEKRATATSHFVSRQATSIDTEPGRPKNSLNASPGDEQVSPVPPPQSLENETDRGQSAPHAELSSDGQLRQVTDSEERRDTLSTLQQSKPLPLVSALNTGVPSKKSPYGDMHDTTGLRPYKPGVRYDRKEQRKSKPLFGGFFGRG